MPFYFDPLSTCDVCLEHFAPPGSGEERDGKTPHVLPCGHVFCLECVFASFYNELHLHRYSCLAHVEGPCPHCRSPFRHDRIHRVHVDTSRDASPPADVHNALRSIDQAGERVRRYEERYAGLSGIDLDDLMAQIQAFIFVHADKAILDIVYCIATVLDKYAEMASQTAAYEQRLRRHEREAVDEKRRRDTLENTYMDTIAHLEEELQRHSIPSPLPPPSQRLGAPSPAAGARRIPAPSAMSRSVSREERQRSIQYEAEMRLQEETGEPSWGGDATEQGNALGLNGPRPRSSSISGGLRPDVSASTERTTREGRTRGSTTRQRDADALLSPVDLDAPSSSRVPYHPARTTQPEPSGSQSRQTNRQERSSASRNIYRESDDNQGDALGLGVPAVSRRSNSTTPFIPPTPLDLSGHNSSTTAGPSGRRGFIPPPPPGWNGSAELPPETPATTSTTAGPPVRRGFIPPPPPGWRDSAEIPPEASTSTSTNTRINRQAPAPVPYIPSPPRDLAGLAPSTSANVHSGHSSQLPPATYFPSPLHDPNSLPTNAPTGSASHSRSHSLHRGQMQQTNPESQQSRRPPVQSVPPTAPPRQSSSRRVPSSAHTPHPNPPVLPESSNHRPRGRSFSEQPMPDSQYAPRPEPAHRPIILPTPAAGSSVSNVPLPGAPSPYPAASYGHSGGRHRSRSTSGPAPPPPPGPPPIQVSAAEPSRPSLTQYSAHGSYAQMPGMPRRATATPSVVSSAGSTWSTAPAVGAAPQAAHPQYNHGRHPSADTTTSHSRHPSLNRHHSNAPTAGRRPSIDASGSSSQRPPPVAIPPSSATSSGHGHAPFTPTHPLAHHSGLPASQSQSAYAQATPYPYGNQGSHGGYARSAPDSGGPPPLARSAPGSSMHTPAPIHASISQPGQGQRPPAPRQESNNLLF
ncbi:hypothetical protein PENSPDRAFT_450397 [Peniophora sp. CONT]|nr:hypothetical protein PENSPDRAFT_450397 [Peniophora sp. CONT]